MVAEEVDESSLTARGTNFGRGGGVDVAGWSCAHTARGWETASISKCDVGIQPVTDVGNTAAVHLAREERAIREERRGEERRGRVKTIIREERRGEAR